MQRRSDKHGPKLDDSLRHDTQSIVSGAPVEARVEEHREQEGLDDGLEARPRDAIEARAELARSIDPSVFPAEPADLVASAERNHAPGWVRHELRRLPNAAYPTTESVWRAMS